MARLSSVKQVWTFMGGYVVALVGIVVGPTFAMRMLEAHGHPSVTTTAAAVLIGSLAFVPLVGLLVWMYFRSDEYERRGMLLNASIAFAISVPVIAALDLLQRTDFLSQWVWAPRWWTMVACWMISMVGVHLARRRGA